MIEEHLALRTTYKKLDSDSAHVIGNDVLSIFDSFTAPATVVHRNKLTAQKSSRNPLFYGLSKAIHTLPLPYPKLHILHFSVVSPKYIYLTLAFPTPFHVVLSICDSPTNQFSIFTTHFMQPVAETLPSYTCYSNISYNPLNFSHLLSILLTNPTVSLLCHTQCTPYPIRVSYIPPSQHEPYHGSPTYRKPNFALAN